MREIKFRAWDKEKKIMFNWSFTEQGLYPQDFFNNDNYQVMQYTGVNDKNGKEIYEGDIVEYETYFIKGNILDVSPIPKVYKKSEVKNNAPWAFSPWWDDYVFEPEVIGNIYEGLHNVKK